MGCTEGVVAGLVVPVQIHQFFFCGVWWQQLQQDQLLDGGRV
jgi:hypothetical protein